MKTIVHDDIHEIFCTCSVGNDVSPAVDVDVRASASARHSRVIHTDKNRVSDCSVEHGSLISGGFMCCSLNSVLRLNPMVCTCLLPGVNVHEQHEGLHGDHVNALAVEARDSENFEVGDAQHHERQQESERVEGHRERGERNGRGGDGTHRARRVEAVVAEPGEARCGRREARGVRPRVGERQHGIPVAHPGAVAKREDHSHPTVHAKRGHGEHGVGAQKSLEEGGRATQPVTSRLLVACERQQRERHVGDGKQQVARGQIEREKARRALPDLGAARKADQHERVGQQRDRKDSEHRDAREHVCQVHDATQKSEQVSLMLSTAKRCEGMLYQARDSSLQNRSTHGGITVLTDLITVFTVGGITHFVTSVTEWHQTGLLLTTASHSGITRMTSHCSFGNYFTLFTPSLSIMQEVIIRNFTVKWHQTSCQWQQAVLHRMASRSLRHKAGLGLRRFRIEKV
ncbi:uncharacterized [Tachysurus ichikawai]